jgi:hypothetical protein
MILFNGIVMPKGLLEEHSRMYAMGEKYADPGLKAVALAKFSFRGPKQISAASVNIATMIAFNSTPESDKDLRKAVLKILDLCRRPGGLLTNFELQKTVSSIPEVAYGLYRKAVERESQQSNIGVVTAKQ